MDEDLIVRLRHCAGNLINGTIEDGEVSSTMLCDAADQIERSRSIDRITAERDAARKALEAFMSAMKTHGQWDDGCFYYSRRSASELEHPMRLASTALVSSDDGNPAAKADR